MYIWLVVSTYPSEKYEFVSWDDELPNIWKIIKFHGSKCSKPPTNHDNKQSMVSLTMATNH